MIQLTNLSISYQDHDVIQNLNLTLPDNQLIALIGSNGAGKSTLLSAIGRITPIDSGSIIIDNRNINDWASDDLAKTVAFLKQEQQLMMRLKVFDLILLGRYPHSKGHYNEADFQVVVDVLESLDLAPIADEYLDQLSGGQRQRAFIGMVMAQDTKYILLDEPVAALDMKHSRNMMRYLKQLVQTQNKSVVMVLHDLNLALGYADYLITMKDGEIIHQGTVEDIATPALFRQLYDCEVTISTINGRKVVYPEL
ncbi:ATP-binding cassette domain-containing protein [Aerococcaceae bacterium DSM 111020]|nr:ATP-binding cassette domain-containing protein [Aerococcaceae bacterium DSM 111020]